MEAEVSSPMKYTLHENLAQKLIFIDGLARCGKSMLTGIIPSLENAEHIQFFTLLELVVPAIAQGGLELSYAKALLRIALNELVYNIRIARGVNFRPGDQSGVPNYKTPKIYYDRLERPEGDEVAQELRQKENLTPFQTHDLLVNLDSLNELEVDYQMLAMFRHPIDNAYSWWKRGWGERFGTDPRAFTLTFEKNGRPLPWYCLDCEEDCGGLNPMEQCIHRVCCLTRRAVLQYKKAKEKNRIHVFTFEDFARFPHQELERICSFLGTWPTSHTENFIRKARCPRVIDPAERQKKLEEFKASVNPEIFKDLRTLSGSYENNLCGICDPALQTGVMPTGPGLKKQKNIAVKKG